MNKKVLVFLGHPDKDTRSGTFADEYEAGAKSAGYEVRRVNIGDLQFDPILHKGYKEIQELEPDLKKTQEDIKWADHIALFYPNWFVSMPALLKGFFDRTWLPGFAFHFKPGSYGSWDRLLKGKSADVFITMDAPPWAERMMFGDYSNEIRKGIFGFAGIAPVRITKIGHMKNMPDDKLAFWKKKIRKHGSRAW
ncbi:MAG: hypothetical protein A3G52_03610 [Candidatus Taylorbacteria bacterium RIFCSPLOWO2_12_FULL_43_20]|uniref:Flavodoxin-like fold domain-containing protein n=1 Tax=Candidatus Taylorbacteria bacterium RIFCSPLOWO2_12_FULL_43_20 TaxID=1802332 RepID=A0A1G2P1M3_9BACT|nr:MAG: hypothetical protein A3E92_04075 [Candidatus Taylorbacteria bacterium RIFCSPHIGHO2_12_FULL_42_34]OHA30253.1 MAG: hypothetical protein A3B09_01280 [Candidatus Taylorbacteria bacterium RIFCSPLOWO2_01_FULL_43_83]OHA39453.1 MAG: hypothetical protein A3H58_01930 [Candidatus Taylorbacteria bacterium RIFCSPLOWO2_02_FULL_43_22b]OHA42246.1 MAG: hypothetical protein A3G52_03610 [Candidatus Taylorbacteria bacterium RIFCSPLOWO2_12_FULL_43_20]